MSKAHTPITTLSTGLAITVLLGIEDAGGLKTLPNDAAVIDEVQDRRSHLTFPSRNGYQTWADNELLLNNVAQFVLRDVDEERLSFEFIKTWEKNVQVNLVVDAENNEVARASSEDMAMKIAAALRATNADGDRKVPVEHQSKLSQSVMEVIYRACQRGGSPEFLHSQVMAVLLHTAAPSPQAAPIPPNMTTDEARQYLVRFMFENFTDATFQAYILGVGRNALAGDFAWQLAKALRRIDEKSPVLKAPSSAPTSTAKTEEN